MCNPDLEMREKMLNDRPEDDSIERPLWRIQTIFNIFYDDDQDEPDQAIRDLLTDLLHMAEHRGVSFVDELFHAHRMAAMERNDWKEPA